MKNDMFCDSSGSFENSQKQFKSKCFKKKNPFILIDNCSSLSTAGVTQKHSRKKKKLYIDSGSKSGSVRRHSNVSNASKNVLKKQHLPKQNGSYKKRSVSAPRPQTRRNPVEMPISDLSERSRSCSRSARKNGLEIKQKSPSTQNKVKPTEIKLSQKENKQETSNAISNLEITVITNENDKEVSSNSYRDNEEKIISEIISSEIKTHIESEKVDDSKFFVKIKQCLSEHEYSQFLLHITEDIIRNECYTLDMILNVLKSHVEANKSHLEVGKMIEKIKQLCKEINLPFEVSLVTDKTDEYKIFLDHSLSKNLHKNTEIKVKEDTFKEPKKTVFGPEKSLNVENMEKICYLKTKEWVENLENSVVTDEDNVPPLCFYEKEKRLNSESEISCDVPNLSKNQSLTSPDLSPIKEKTEYSIPITNESAKNYNNEPECSALAVKTTEEEKMSENSSKKSFILEKPHEEISNNDDKINSSNFENKFEDYLCRLERVLDQMRHKDCSLSVKSSMLRNTTIHQPIFIPMPFCEEYLKNNSQLDYQSNEKMDIVNFVPEYYCEDCKNNFERFFSSFDVKNVLPEFHFNVNDCTDNPVKRRKRDGVKSEVTFCSYFSTKNDNKKFERTLRSKQVDEPLEVLKPPPSLFIDESCASHGPSTDITNATGEILSSLTSTLNECHFPGKELQHKKIKTCNERLRFQSIYCDDRNCENKSNKAVGVQCKNCPCVKNSNPKNIPIQNQLPKTQRDSCKHDVSIQCVTEEDNNCEGIKNENKINMADPSKSPPLKIDAGSQYQRVSSNKIERAESKDVGTFNRELDLLKQKIKSCLPQNDDDNEWNSKIKAYKSVLQELSKNCEPFTKGRNNDNGNQKTEKSKICLQKYKTAACQKDSVNINSVKTPCEMYISSKYENWPVQFKLKKENEFIPQQDLYGGIMQDAFTTMTAYDPICSTFYENNFSKTCNKKNFLLNDKYRKESSYMPMTLAGFFPNAETQTSVEDRHLSLKSFPIKMNDAIKSDQLKPETSEIDLQIVTEESNNNNEELTEKEKIVTKNTSAEEKTLKSGENSTTWYNTQSAVTLTETDVVFKKNTKESYGEESSKDLLALLMTSFGSQKEELEGENMELVKSANKLSDSKKSSIEYNNDSDKKDAAKGETGNSSNNDSSEDDNNDRKSSLASNKTGDVSMDLNNENEYNCCGRKKLYKRSTSSDTFVSVKLERENPKSTFASKLDIREFNPDSKKVESEPKSSKIKIKNVERETSYNKDKPEKWDLTVAQDHNRNRRLTEKNIEAIVKRFDRTNSILSSDETYVEDQTNKKTKPPKERIRSRSFYYDNNEDNDYEI